MRHIITRHRTLPFVLLCLSPGLALGQSVHSGDYAPRVSNGALEVGVYDLTFGAVSYPSPLNTAEFGAEGFANFTNDPGVNSEPGALLPDMALGFDLLGSVLVWTGEQTGFDTISPQSITVRDGFDSAVSPSTQTTVPGFIFGFAGSDAPAVIHSHVQFLLDLGNPAPIDGVWLLQWRLWADEPGIAPSHTLYTVFTQGTGNGQAELALQWVKDNLLTPACPADLNGDGVLDNGDIGAFVVAFLASDLAADFNADGILDNGDIGVFVAAFLAGC